jgi:outer membrane scaffolding protein for murein synthesis (MipA/OmpV family)
MKFSVFIFCFLSALISGVSFAFDSENAIVDEWSFSLYLGDGKIENPIAELEDLELTVFPSISFYGEKFFIEGTTIGYSLFETDDVIVDLVGLLNEDGLFHHFNDHQDLSVVNILGFNPTSRGEVITFEPIKRDISYLGGISATFINDYFDIRLGGFQDVTGVHDGNELHLSASKSFSTPWFNAYIELGKVIKSRQLVEYYYQFQNEELALLEELKSDYQPKRSRNFYYKIQFNVPITQALSVVGLVKQTQLGNNIKQSLLVKKGNYLASFIGFRYQF